MVSHHHAVWPFLNLFACANGRSIYSGTNQKWVDSRAERQRDFSDAIQQSANIRRSHEVVSPQANASTTYCASARLPITTARLETTQRVWLTHYDDSWHHRPEGS